MAGRRATDHHVAVYHLCPVVRSKEGSGIDFDLEQHTSRTRTLGTSILAHMREQHCIRCHAPNSQDHKFWVSVVAPEGRVQNTLLQGDNPSFEDAFDKALAKLADTSAHVD